MQKNKGLLLILSTAVISGFSVFINKYGVSVINPYVFTWLKNLSVALILTGLILAFKDWRVLKFLTKKQWSWLLTIGLVGGAIPFLLFFKGLSMVSAAEGSFIQKTMFIYIAVLAVIFLKEKIDRKFLAAASLLLIGNILLLKNFHLSFSLGSALIMIATIFWAMENVISKFMLRELPWRMVAWARMFFGSIFIFGFLFFTRQAELIVNLNFKQIGWVAITALFLLGYVATWYSGLKEVEVMKAAAVLLLGSPITTILALISGSKIEAREIFAGALIILGIVLIIDIGNILQKTKEIWRKRYARS
jgi:drug/metabolite transporter (DMT)-like permease